MQLKERMWPVTLDSVVWDLTIKCSWVKYTAKFDSNYSNFDNELCFLALERYLSH